MSDPNRTSQSTRHATGPAGAAARTPAAAVAPATRHPLAAVYRLLITAAALTGLVLAAVATPGPTRLLASFTAQANLAAALVSAASAHRAWTGRRPLSPGLTGAVLSFLTLAAVLHHALPATSTTVVTLPSPTPGTPAPSLSPVLLTTLTPLAALADWLLLTTPRGFRPRHAWQWPAYPLLYLATTLALPTPAGTRPGSLTTTLTLALASCLLPVITIAIDQVRPSPRLSRNRISPTGIGPLK
ncbi:integral membrane regulator [Streptomyces bugieae]|uniref:Integral membrane regulator n=1 Tax=Streptomyces bugieae TaxID=3098223 RepID=A0ABU7NUI8_9ACTN|nr:integral membrane regulator [Streptomyces sp. DSM 41528]